MVYLLLMDKLAAKINKLILRISKGDKDDNKKSLWKDLILQDKEVFADFIPLFQAIHSLFGLSEF